MKKIIFIILFLCIAASSIQAEELPMASRLGVGLNYPGISLRYWFKRCGIEVKGQFGEDIQIYGLRWYKGVFGSHNPVIYLGLEGDYIGFKGDESKGTGGAYEVFLGGELLIKKPITINIDIGPSFIVLKDKDTSEIQSGFDIICNIGINYYFGGTQ